MEKMIRRDRKLGIKALSLAAIAGLTLFGLQAQADTQTTSPFGRGADVNEQSKLYIGGEGLNRNGTITGAAAEITPTLRESSLFNILVGTEDNYTFTIPSYTETSYYKISIKTNQLSDSGSINWIINSTVTQETAFTFNGTAGTGTIGITLPHNGATETEYYTYEYAVPTEYARQTGRLTNLADNINKKYFYGISNSNTGTAIYNTSINEYNIIADFINNKTTGAQGTIYNNGLANDPIIPIYYQSIKINWIIILIAFIFVI